MARSDHLIGLEHITCPIAGRRLCLRRAWPRDAGRLLLEYVDEGDGDRGASTVAGQWFADAARLRVVAAQTSAVAGSARRVARLDDLGVVLQRAGADRRLRALAGALAAPGSELVVHRPERRAVVRLARPRATTYLKVLRPGRLPVSLSGVGSLFTAAEIRRDPSSGTIEYAELAGTCLHDLLGDGASTESEVVSALHATGTCLRSLHASTPGPGSSYHDAGAEIGVAARWLDHAVAHRALPPADAERARSALAVAAALLASHGPSVKMGLVHRDLHDKQVMVDSCDGVGVLDLDTLARGDPALDVANFLVHLDLRSLQGHCSQDRADAAAAAFLEGYRPHLALTHRLPAYAAATRLRLACVYAFRPRWRGVAGRLLGAG